MKLSTQSKFKRMAQVQELKEKEEEYDEGPKGDFEGQEDEDLKNKEKVTVPVVRRPRQYQNVSGATKEEDDLRLARCDNLSIMIHNSDYIAFQTDVQRQHILLVLSIIHYRQEMEEIQCQVIINLRWKCWGQKSIKTLHDRLHLPHLSSYLLLSRHAGLDLSQLHSLILSGRGLKYCLNVSETELMIISPRYK